MDRRQFVKLAAATPLLGLQTNGAAIGPLPFSEEERVLGPESASTDQESDLSPAILCFQPEVPSPWWAERSPLDPNCRYARSALVLGTRLAEDVVDSLIARLPSGSVTAQGWLQTPDELRQFDPARQDMVHIVIEAASAGRTLRHEALAFAQNDPQCVIVYWLLVAPQALGTTFRLLMSGRTGTQRSTTILVPWVQEDSERGRAILESALYGFIFSVTPGWSALAIDFSDVEKLLRGRVGIAGFSVWNRGEVAADDHGIAAITKQMPDGIQYVSGWSFYSFPDAIPSLEELELQSEWMVRIVADSEQTRINACLPIWNDEERAAARTLGDHVIIMALA